ncbi:MAG TPA: hypothetical protein VN257_04345 [Actinotalea sp.]|nr:hypothetical protein [Actinotalea sp.]
MIRTPDPEPSAAPWQVRPLVEVVARLMAVVGDPAGRPAVVAVDGREGGGKSTAAGRIAAAVPGAVVVHTDDVAWWESFFGWDRLLAEGVLAPVRRGEAVSFTPPAWPPRGRPGAIEVPAGVPLVVVEGVGAGRRSLGPMLDAVVWVQSDHGEARRRGIARDGGESATAFWDEWEAEELVFLAQDRPWERAAVVLCGTPDVDHDPEREAVVGRPLTGAAGLRTRAGRA